MRINWLGVDGKMKLFKAVLKLFIPTILFALIVGKYSAFAQGDMVDKKLLVSEVLQSIKLFLTKKPGDALTCVPRYGVITLTDENIGLFKILAEGDVTRFVVSDESPNIADVEIIFTKKVSPPIAFSVDVRVIDGRCTEFEVHRIMD